MNPSKTVSSRRRTNRFEYQMLEARQLLSANLPSVDGQIELTRDYIASNADTAYLLDGKSDLTFIEVKHGLASTTTRFQQTIDDIPVHGAVVTLNQGPTGGFQDVHHDQAYNPASVVFPDPQDFPFSFSAAEQVAMQRAGVGETYVPTRVEAAWYVHETGQIHQAWDMTVYSALQPVGDFLTIVDMSTLEVLMQENRAGFATGTGDIFEPNPWQSQGNGTGLADNDDADSAELTGQLITVTLEGLDEGTGLVMGEFVDLATLNSPDLDDVDADEADRVYQYTRDDPRFEQIVIYHSVDQINRYFHELGFDDDTGVPNGIRDFPTLANAHWYAADQSFYSTADDAIHFGDGGVDDGEDADIVAHEYGHAIQFNQNAAWGGGEMGAMGEGFGDYLAAAFYKDFGDPDFLADHAAAVGEWDATSYSGGDPPNLRRVDGNKIYPTDLVGQVHADGEIWSRALWDLNANMGGSYADQLILEHHFMLPAGATMPTAANTILQANQNINGGANLAQVRHPFVERGILNPQTIANFTAEIYQEGDSLVFYVSDINPPSPVSVTITSSDGDSESISLVDTGNGLLRGEIATDDSAIVANDGKISVINPSTEVVLNYSGNGFATDTAIIEADVTVIEGTNDNDVINVIIDSIVTVTVNGVDHFIDTSTQASMIFDAKGGYDRITILDSDSNETAVISNNSVTIEGFFRFQGQNVEDVHITSGGGNDTVRIFGTDRDELFQSFGELSSLTGDGFEYAATNYSKVLAFAMGGFDRAQFGDSPGNDRFYGTPTFANLTTDSLFVNARDFDKTSIHSSNGGFDIASLNGTDGADELFANATFANLKGDGIEMTAAGFDRTWANGGDGNDEAFLIGTDGNDIFNSGPFNAYLYSTGYFNQVVNFENVTATAGDEGNDRAILRDSPGEDIYHGTPTTSVLYNELHRSRANGFATVSAIGSAGDDIATFADSSGNDRYVARPDDAYMIGEGFLNYVRQFDRVIGRSTQGMDISVLYAAPQDARAYASRETSYLSGLNYLNSANNFRYVTINMNPSGFNIGTFQDSNGDDTFVGKGTNATLFGDDYLVYVTGLDRATATSDQGGFDVLAANAVDYQFASFGNWN